MFVLEKSFNFEAGHVLVKHDGKCRNPHGHSYVLTVQLKGENLHDAGPKTNMLVDFQDISSVVKKLIEESLDHKWLNETLENDSPTTELIAKWIFDKLKGKFPLLHAVTLQETPSSKVTYTE